jgi:alkylation response protein AidB-like acyl-CoA dehydrogenase
MSSLERTAKRQALLNAVEDIREILASCIDDSEANATLAPPAVEALRDAGLFQLRLPAELGGAEADPLTQLEVFEELAYIDPASGWCTMVGSASVAALAAFLPQAGIERVFPHGCAPLAASSFYPAGTAVPEDGGYRVNGRWRFASGIHHADWVWAGAVVARDGNDPEPGETPPEVIYVALPTQDIQIHDSWHVMGLRGTGSCDFSIVDYYAVPELIMQWDPAMPEPLRGGSLYRLPSLAFVAHEHVAFAAGLARRALDELTHMATTQRGKFRPSALVERPVFHRLLGESDLKLRAARSLAFDLYVDTWQKVCRGESIDPELQAELRGVATYITDIAVDITTWAFRCGGAGVLFQPNIFERLFREMNAAAQHILTSDSAYENHGQFRLGLPDANPMD